MSWVVDTCVIIDVARGDQGGKMQGSKFGRGIALSLVALAALKALAATEAGGLAIPPRPQGSDGQIDGAGGFW